MISVKTITTVVALGATLVASSAAAQCRPPSSSHEARLLAFYEAPIVFSMAGAPERLSFGALRLGGEVIPVPSPSPVLQHPSYCYQYTTNNTKLAPVFGRPRATIGLPASFALEASYLPSITVGDAQANLASFALSRIQTAPLTGGRMALLLRAHLTTGQVRGSITCPRSNLQSDDVAAPCYGSQPSRDTFHPNSYGFEAALATNSEGGGIGAYAGAGVSSLTPLFRAGFTDGLGHVDNTTVDVDLVRGVAFGGATIRPTSSIAISAQLYVVPADVTTIRIGAQYRLR